MNKIELYRGMPFAGKYAAQFSLGIVAISAFLISVCLYLKGVYPEFDWSNRSIDLGIRLAGSMGAIAYLIGYSLLSYNLIKKFLVVLIEVSNDGLKSKLAVEGLVIIVFHWVFAMLSYEFVINVICNPSLILIGR
jgi:hypothetical protein